MKSVYGGKGVLNINEVLVPKLVGVDVRNNYFNFRDSDVLNIVVIVECWLDLLFVIVDDFILLFFLFIYFGL